MKFLDTHRHFWRYTETEFGWIGDELADIRRDFLPGKAPPPGGWFEGFIAVQARQTIEETRWLCDLARQYPWIVAVVGWLPLASPEIERMLAERDPKVVGMRHVLQAESPALFADAAFNNGLRVLAKHELSYDLLVTESQLPQTIELVDRHPGLTFILDHLAKPVLVAGPSAAWRNGMVDLGRRPNVYCKVSGGIAEADVHFKPHSMEPYFEVALEAFGPQRLMYGSNYPVSDVVGGNWSGEVFSWIVPKLEDPDCFDFYRHNAIRAYRLQEKSWSLSH